jgi:uncharacterized membrane protein YqhA
MKRVEHGIEGALWASRHLVMVGVIASLVAALAMLYMAAVDTFTLAAHALHYARAGASAETRAAMRLSAVTHVVEIVDGFLLAAFLVIFALGLYELFVSKIDAAEGSALAGNILYVRSLDDLKGKLGQVILIMLVVKFFEQAASVHPAGAYELLAAAGSVALIGVALYLAGASRHQGGHGGA